MAKPALSYCAQQVREGDRDRFLAALFVPEPERETLFAVAALNLELARVREAVKEEMLGHIRHAWWQERVEGLYGGLATPGQPVLEALKPALAKGHLPQSVLMPLLTAYREQFPQTPENIDPLMDGIAVALLEATRPLAKVGWLKARAAIQHHRQQYGQRWNGWLMIKLLLIGFR